MSTSSIQTIGIAPGMTARHYPISPRLGERVTFAQYRAVIRELLALCPWLYRDGKPIYGRPWKFERYTYAGKPLLVCIIGEWPDKHNCGWKRANVPHLDLSSMELGCFA